MVRVPLPFRGVAVLLLAASTAFGQTPEPPAEFFSLDSPGLTAPTDFLREFSADTRHPLLSLMVDGEVAALDAAQAQDSAKLKPTPKSSAAPAKTDAKTEASDGIPVDGCQDGCLGGSFLGGGGLGDGCSLGGCGPVENLCPTMPNLLPFACAPPPCGCRKCQRKCGHKHCGGCGYGGGNGNYMNGPSCAGLCFYGAPLVPGYDGCCCRRCGHKRCGGCQNYGCPFGGWDGDGWNTMGGAGYGDGGCGMACMPPQGCCQKCHRHHRNRCCGCAGYGSPYGGGWGMGYGGWDGGCCMPPPAPTCCSRRCHHKHGCASGYGYSGWGGCGMASVYAACNVPCYQPCYSCGKHHWFGRCHRCHGCQQSYPSYPCTTMPCMGCDGFGMGGGGYGMGGGGYGMGGGGYSMGGDGFGMAGDGFVSDGSFGDGMAFDPTMSGTSN